MKKFYTMILAAFTAVATVCANPVARVSGDSHDPDPMMSEMLRTFTGVDNPKKQSKAEQSGYNVHITDFVVENGNVIFEWFGDNDDAVYYDIQLGVLDDSQYGYTLFAEGVWNNSILPLNEEGDFLFSTELLLQYGFTYKDYPQYFSQEVYEANVIESDNTIKLKPNDYVIFIEGLDENYDTAEEYDYVIIPSTEFASLTTSGLTNETSYKNTTKYIRNGNVYIKKGEKVYDVLGTLVE